MLFSQQYLFIVVNLTKQNMLSLHIDVKVVFFCLLFVRRFEGRNAYRVTGLIPKLNDTSRKIKFYSVGGCVARKKSTVLSRKVY